MASELHRITFDPEQCGGRPWKRPLAALTQAATGAPVTRWHVQQWQIMLASGARSIR